MDLIIESQDDSTETGGRSGKPVSVRVDVFFLPEFYSNNQFAGRSDLGTPRRKVGSLSDTEDLEGSVRKLAMGPGAYFAECRIGRDVSHSDIFELKPRGQSLVIESQHAPAPAQTAPVIPPAPAPQVESSPAQSIITAADTVRAVKDLAREVAPPVQQPASLTKEEIAQMVKQAIAEATAQAQSAKPKEAAAPDPLQNLVSTVNVFKQLGLIREPKETAPEKTDQLETFLSLHERMLDISERINPEGKTNRNWFDKAVGAVESLANAAPRVAPYIAQAMRMRAAMQDGQPATLAESAAPEVAQPSQAASEAAQPLDELQALTNVARMIAEEFKAGHRVGRTADLIEEYAIKFPSVRPNLNGLISDEPANILQSIGMLGVEIPQTRAACDWIADLQEELSGDDEEEAAATNTLEPVAPETNGHSTATVAA